MKVYRYCKAFGCILIFLAVVLIVSDAAGYTFYLNQYVYFQNFIWIIVSAIVVMAAATEICIKSRRSVILLISLLGIVTVFALKAKYGQFHSSYAYITEQYSPNKEHKIVFYEYRGVFLNYGTVYEVCVPMFMKKLGSYWSERIMPVKDNAYQIEWNENDFIFHYEYRGTVSENDTKTDCLVLEYAR